MWRRGQRALASSARALGEGLFLPLCALCPGLDEGDGLGCREHRFEPRLSGPRCGRCAARLPPALPDGWRCAACARQRPAFERLVALADYRQAGVRAWVLALKHGGRRDLALPLGRLLAARLELEPQHPPLARRLLVPVPLHPLRRLERGHDQAALLAGELARAGAGEPCRALRRVRATPPQGSPGAPARPANVRGAFAPGRGAWLRRGALAQSEVWLIDDVATSGATLSECARALRRLGARRVRALVVARA